MRLITAQENHVLPLGRLGENEATRVAFPLAVVCDDPEGATFSVLNQPAGGRQSYPIAPAALSVQDDALIWTVTSADLAHEGVGQCEVVAFRGTQIVKSTCFMTSVLYALDGSAAAPDPWRSWQTAFSKLYEDTQEAAEHYPRISESGTWEVWDVENETWADTGVNAGGQPMTGATASADGTGGSVPAPLAGFQDHFLRASGEWADPFGGSTEKAPGWGAVAHGSNPLASGNYSYAGGNNVQATGQNSHAEGSATKAMMTSAHAEGDQTIAIGYASHAEGSRTIARAEYQHVFGMYNLPDTGPEEEDEWSDSSPSRLSYAHYLEIVGNGNAASRSNARTLDVYGDEWLAGGLSTGGSVKIRSGSLRIGSTSLSEQQLQALLALLQ